MKAATVAMRAAILCYRHALSPVLPGACRFQPSCSQYALEAISRFGARKGGWLTLKRLARCHPWGGWGYDPVPPGPGRRDESHLAGCRQRGQDHPLSCQTRAVEE
jgi:putative membrane protein insertion efficiency factor